MESKPSNTIKILYSYGGKIRLRSTDGELRYVGGHTRVLAVDRSISFSGSHLRVLSSLSFEFLSSLRSLYSSILLIFCRIDGEAWRIVRFICDFTVSITKRRFRNVDFHHQRWRFNQHNRRIRTCLVETNSSVEDQSNSFAAEIEFESFTWSIIFIVKCQFVSGQITSYLRWIATVCGGVSDRTSQPLAESSGRVFDRRRSEWICESLLLYGPVTGKPEKPKACVLWASIQ